MKQMPSELIIGLGVATTERIAKMLFSDVDTPGSSR
jgi:hypothetical protein